MKRSDFSRFFHDFSLTSPVRMVYYHEPLRPHETTRFEPHDQAEACGQRQFTIAKRTRTAITPWKIGMENGKRIGSMNWFKGTLIKVIRGTCFTKPVDTAIRQPGSWCRWAQGFTSFQLTNWRCWKNLVWEFRKRDTVEAQQVFGDYFVAATESGPFAEMIEAISEKIREAAAVWMNETAFDTLRDCFIKEIDSELGKRLHLEHDLLNLIIQDKSMIKALINRFHVLNNCMNIFWKTDSGIDDKHTCPLFYTLNIRLLI